MSERIQKVLARAGIASRRAIETLISDGKIKVNGRTAVLGDQIGPEDRVQVDGQPVSQDKLIQQPCQILLYHKQVGEVCTRHDPEKRPTIFKKLPKLKKGSWIAVGRLDINTSGLIMLTTDGELANRLMHPSSEIEREYAVRVFGQVTEEMAQRLLQGVMLDDGLAKFEKIMDSGGEASNHWYHVTLKEGRNREVRRLWESQGIAVSRLVRVRYGDIWLERSLRPGRCELLDEKQVNLCRKWVGLTPIAEQRAIIRRAKEVIETKRNPVKLRKSKARSPKKHTPRARIRRENRKKGRK
ncbi:MAG: pseudouridine synthase [Gammaproteobacteria bacterium]|nr:pseudouridine synthase [Gammaproteobacteria bacterium]MCF6229929.1 pseudouridine synthase [Gammaproteobacteria bacterium]